MSGSPPTLQTVSDNELKRYITRKQAEIFELERAIAIQNQQIDALDNRIQFNKTLLETSKVKKDKAMKEYINYV
jgi:hypothetical protein